MNKMKRFVGTAGIYLTGNVLSKLISFFLLPLYTSKLPPEQFGTYDLVVTIISLTAPVAFFQIWDGMFRFTFEKKETKGKYHVISNSFIVWLLGLVVYSIAFVGLFMVFRFENGFIIYIYGVSVALQYQYVFIARAFLKNKLFALSGLINSFLSAVVNIVLILGFDMGLKSLYIAPVLGCIAQIIIIEISLRPLRSFRLCSIKGDDIMEMIKFSIPLCAATVLHWLLSGCTKIAISGQLGTHSNGLYAVANRFSSMVLLMLAVFQYAWNEMAYLMAKDNDRAEKYQKSVEYIFKAVMLGSGVFILCTKLLFPYFVAPVYFDALSIVPLSIIGVAVNGFAGFIDTIFMTEKQTRWAFRTALAGAGVNITALCIFVPIWGLQGAVGALCLAFSAIALMRAIVLVQIFKLQFSLINLLYCLILAIAVLVFYTVGNPLIILFIIILLGGISLYCIRDLLKVLFIG